ncbi:tautomerase family protein [Sphingobium yanoikuyae]|uniref:Tautomerase family protein n=1 Tax=Sphingobium yanoikuyae TaxID=13690 RepID=A0A291MYQ3_SPHYA|nr:tautomerase family protein [Sphingobium yanoikuyae]ATI80030.1 tautomerase family protein [Sphingobium yanoikuyae]
MPLFQAHVPTGRYTAQQRTAMVEAFTESLVDGFALPVDDRFVVISEHGPDGLFIHPTYGDMKRSDRAIIVTVVIPETRPRSEKRKFLEAIVKRLGEKVGVAPDDVFITLIPIPRENFSFGRGFSPFDPGD